MSEIGFTVAMIIAAAAALNVFAAVYKHFSQERRTNLLWEEHTGGAPLSPEFARKEDCPTCVTWFDGSETPDDEHRTHTKLWNQEMRDRAERF